LSTKYQGRVATSASLDFLATVFMLAFHVVVHRQT
jgi:hypothetical protein